MQLTFRLLLSKLSSFYHEGKKRSAVQSIVFVVFVWYLERNTWLILSELRLKTRQKRLLYLEATKYKTKVTINGNRN